jgi:hypothetical protein
MLPAASNQQRRTQPQSAPTASSAAGMPRSSAAPRAAATVPSNSPSSSQRIGIAIVHRTHRAAAASRLPPRPLLRWGKRRAPLRRIQHRRATLRKQIVLIARPEQGREESPRSSYPAAPPPPRLNRPTYPFTQQLTRHSRKTETPMTLLSASSSIPLACETLPAPSVRITSPSRATFTSASTPAAIDSAYSTPPLTVPVRTDRLHQPLRIHARNRLLARRVDVQHLHRVRIRKRPRKLRHAGRASAYTDAAGTAHAPAHTPHPAPPAASP